MMHYPYHFFTGETAADPCTTCELDYEHALHHPSHVERMIPTTAAVPDFNDAEAELVSQAREQSNLWRNIQENALVRGLLQVQAKRENERRSAR